MSPPLDWLSLLLDMTPVRGRLDLRCLYGAPWRIDQAASQVGEVPYHVLLAGSALLEDPSGGPPLQLVAGDILLLRSGDAHILHDGSGKAPRRAYARTTTNLVFSENKAKDEALDMLCGHFMLSSRHERILRDYLPDRLVVSSANGTENDSETGAQLSALLDLLRVESARDALGGRAMLDALSTALFALTLRLATESDEAPTGLLALAGSPRLGPALEAMLHEPGKAWTLPTLAALCHMSRATFARLFQEKFGRSASDLLTDIRMTLAANELRKPGLSTGAVAESVGYQSEAAFQRAFKSHMGMTPARWRRADPSRSG